MAPQLARTDRRRAAVAPAAPAPAEAVAAARAAGLRHVDDRRPGLGRRPSGKRVWQGKRRVAESLIVDAAGRPVRDEAILTRIRKLAIPPAWRDVWICPDPAGHLQATGRDARGRKQYRYHPRWRAERDSNKYSRMIEFGRVLPLLRRRIATDLRRPGLPRGKVLATVVKLLEITFIRVGNEEYARSNRSFGLTTLEDRHVDVRPSGVRFHFRGKSGVFHHVSVEDPSIARIVRRCRDLPGQELFQYLNEEGQPATIDSADVNEYIHEVAGQDFTAKDFRTWAGTVMAAMALRELIAAAHGKGPIRPTNRNVVRAIERVAERLGNTPSVCRKCYVHPEVIASYLDGTLASALARRLDAPAGRRVRGLRPEEAAVLALLRRRAAQEKNEAKGGAGRLERQLRRSLRRRPHRRAAGAAPAQLNACCA
jgi:DNA topoisomerase-1